MGRNTRSGIVEGAITSPPTEAWLIAQMLLGKPVPSSAVSASDAKFKREHAEWLAAISDKHRVEQRRALTEHVKATPNPELLEWLSCISTPHEGQFQRQVLAEAEAAKAQARSDSLLEQLDGLLTEWEPAKHPRGAFAQNRGWFSQTSGSSGGATSSRKKSSLFDAAIKRNQEIGKLSGVVTPGMVSSSGLAAELDAAIRLPAEVSSAAAKGLGTGAPRLLPRRQRTSMKSCTRGRITTTLKPAMSKYRLMVTVERRF